MVEDDATKSDLKLATWAQITRTTEERDLLDGGSTARAGLSNRNFIHQSDILARISE